MNLDTTTSNTQSLNGTTPSPPVLLPYQQRWIADPSPVKVIEKSRRIGITWAEAADCALMAAAKDGQDTWYLGYNRDMAEEFILDCAFWSKAYQLSAAETKEIVLKDADKDILAFRIRYASGHRVTALSSSPSNLRGKQGRVVIDEAAFHVGFPELLKAAIAYLMWGGSVHIISTHNGIDNDFYRLVEEIRAGKRNYSLHRVTIDDAIADGLVKRICLKLGISWSPRYEGEWRADLFESYGDDADEELMVIPSKSGGAYLTPALVETRMEGGTVLRLGLPDSFTQLDEITRQREITKWLNVQLAPVLQGLPKNLRSWYGMDFARNEDLSAIAVLLEEQNLHRCCPLILEMRNVPFKAQSQILFFLIDGLGDQFCGAAHDARGNGQYLVEAAQGKYRGNIIDAVMASETWYLKNFPPYKAALEDGSITLPRDSDVLADHTAVRLENGIPKVPAGARYKGTDGGYRHGDSVIALLLAYYACRTKTRPIRSSRGPVNQMRLPGIAF